MAFSRTCTEMPSILNGVYFRLHWALSKAFRSIYSIPAKQVYLLFEPRGTQQFITFRTLKGVADLSGFMNEKSVNKFVSLKREMNVILIRICGGANSSRSWGEKFASFSCQIVCSVKKTIHSKSLMSHMIFLFVWKISVIRLDSRNCTNLGKGVWIVYFINNAFKGKKWQNNSSTPSTLIWELKRTLTKSQRTTNIWDGSTWEKRRVGPNFFFHKWFECLA